MVPHQKKLSLASQVAAEVDRAWRLIEAKRPDAAWQVLVEAEKQAQAAGIASPNLEWALAVAADLLDDAEPAVAHIARAVELEPCSRSIQRSRDIIVRRTRMTFDDLPASDGGISHLCVLLLKLDAVDADVAVKYSQCSLLHGEIDSALEWAEAAIEIQAPTAKRLRHLARVLELSGQHDAAKVRKREAEALAVTFPMAEAEA